jgi:hypothetical protein
MAWETRKGKGRYYTRSRRIDGRIVREYLGKDEMAHISALIDEEARLERQEERQCLRIEREATDAVDDLLRQMFNEVDLTVRLSLEATGYHRHKRSEWRKRRDSKTPKRY